MPRIADLIANPARPSLSVEFFPPKTPAADVVLQQTLKDIRRLPIDFVSVTYGAGGSTRERTRDLVVDINSTESYPAMAHLTCIGHTKLELEALLDDYEQSGVRNILALAGDPPADGSTAHGDFTYALELVDMIRSRGDHFSVAVAAHPELHPRSSVRHQDREHLAAKLAIADFAITQFFFEASDYFRMVEEVGSFQTSTSSSGSGMRSKPIIPGIMPMTNPEGVRRMATMSKTKFPERLGQRIEEAAEADRFKIAVDAATELCRELLDGGAPGLHLYGLNRSETVGAIVDNLDLV